MDNGNLISILIIDDDSSDIKTLSYILGSSYTVYTEKEGKKAVETAERLIPDMILLDIIMPEMDGYEVFMELKRSSKTKDIPIIFISGLSSVAAEKKGLEMGAVDYISKPFSPEVVKLRVLNQIKILKAGVMEKILNKEINISKEITEALLQNKNLSKDITEGLEKINESCNLIMSHINDSKW